jgi:hypothetical protein
LVASLTNFAPHQFLQQIVTADETWVHLPEPGESSQYGLEMSDITRG